MYNIKYNVLTNWSRYYESLITEFYWLVSENRNLNFVLNYYS